VAQDDEFCLYWRHGISIPLQVAPPSSRLLFLFPWVLVVTVWHSLATNTSAVWQRTEFSGGNVAAGRKGENSSSVTSIIRGTSYQRIRAMAKILPPSASVFVACEGQFCIYGSNSPLLHKYNFIHLFNSTSLVVQNVYRPTCSCMLSTFDKILNS
jgi:hypothetical protein